MMALFDALLVFEMALLVLVAKGFWPFVLDKDASHRLRNLGIAVQVLTITTGLRVFWWDIMPMIFHADTLTVVRDITGNRLVPNMIFALLTSLACLTMLRTLWLLIPKEDQKYYTIFTAPFYPRLHGVLRSGKED
jgi:hypothetical protein